MAFTVRRIRDRSRTHDGVAFRASRRREPNVFFAIVRRVARARHSSSRWVDACDARAIARARATRWTRTTRWATRATATRARAGARRRRRRAVKVRREIARFDAIVAVNDAVAAFAARERETDGRPRARRRRADDQCWICLDGDTADREVRARRRATTRATKDRRDRPFLVRM